jgi:hypothetical protein
MSTRFLELLSPFIKELFLSDGSKEDTRKSVKQTVVMLIITIVIFASMLGRGLGNVVKAKKAQEQQLKMEISVAVEKSNNELLKQLDIEPPKPIVVPVPSSPLPEKKEDRKKTIANDRELARRMRDLYETEKKQDEQKNN